MKIAFVSVALNIHQVGIADELWNLTSEQFYFIETKKICENQRKGGNKDYSDRPYLIQVAENKLSEKEVLDIVRTVDVMIYGAAPLVYLKERIKTGKLTFVNSERWLKKGLINLFSPNLIKQQWFYQTHCRRKPIYALCSSAYAASDYNILHSYRNKCFKWGYFTEITNLNIECIQKLRSDSSIIKILWVARFLPWKHPESMVQLALDLYRNKVNFLIEMIGVGPEFDRISLLIKKTGLEKYVHLLGSLPNNLVLETMRSHDIFCFTSDKNEGWGAVLNEAMSVGCCPVASIDAGATPYLITDGINGLTFNLKKKNDLFTKVMWLIKHPEDRTRMSIEAYKTIRDVWSPQNAAKNLYQLCEGLLEGNLITINEGPCSRA